MKKGRITPPKFIGSYYFGDYLGSGAFSSVYKAKNIQTNNQVAIKIFPKSSLKNRKDQERFQQEIDSMAYFNSPYIVKLNDFLWDDTNFYLIMDLCEGGELYDYILENDRIDEKSAATIFKQVIAAISYSHANKIAHRDIKPQNILITEFPNIRIADFGLATYINNSELTDNFCGSPMYCSPECLRRQKYDAKISDIWSMGVLLYTMVVGNPPWQSGDPVEILKQIMLNQIVYPNYLSKRCKHLISIMLKVNPTERASLEEISNDPWLEICDTNIILPQSSDESISSVDPSLAPPPANPYNKERITMARLNIASEKGIFSPFSTTRLFEEQRNKLFEQSLPSLHATARKRPKIKSTARSSTKLSQVSFSLPKSILASHRHSMRL